MTYAERIYGTTREVEENREDDGTDTRLIGLAWRKFTDPAARRNLRYNTASRAAFAFAWAERLIENSRHRGALAMLQ
jgi:hypothetical protein